MTDRAIAGVLDLEAQARLNFTVLTEAEQREAIRNMRRVGFSENTIAAATGWSVEMIRRALGKEPAP